MNYINFSFEISKQMFIELYRTHVRYKFKLRRSMIMSVCLLMFGLAMQFIFKMDFSFINTIVFWITVFAVIMNFLSDYILPKTAYNNLVRIHGEKGSFTSNDEGFDLILSDHTEKKLWKDFDSCIEIDCAFLLYKKDLFTVIVKDKGLTEDLRELFKININKGIDIKIK